MQDLRFSGDFEGHIFEGDIFKSNYSPDEINRRDPFDRTEHQSKGVIRKILALGEIYRMVENLLNSEPEISKSELFKQIRDYEKSVGVKLIDTKFVNRIIKQRIKVQKIKKAFCNGKIDSLGIIRKFFGVYLSEDYKYQIRVAFSALSIDIFMSRKTFNYLLKEMNYDSICNNITIDGISFNYSFINIIIIEDDYINKFISSYSTDRSKPIDVNRLENSEDNYLRKLFLVLKHERQHKITDFFSKKVFIVFGNFLYNFVKTLKPIYKVLLNNEYLQNFLMRFVKELALEMAKHELISLIAECSNMELDLKEHIGTEVKEKLLMNYDESKINTYYDCYLNPLLNYIDSNRLKLMLDQYNSILLMAYQSILDLQNNNFSPREILSILIFYDLSKWNKVTRLLIKDRNRRKKDG